MVRDFPRADDDNSTVQGIPNAMIPKGSLLSS